MSVLVCIVIDAIEGDDSNILTGNNFNIEAFFHSDKLPVVVSINSTYELSDVFIDAKLSQFGPKGN